MQAKRLLQQVKKTFFDLFSHFFVFLLYGSWEALDSFKILPQGPPAFSTPGEAIPRLFEKSTFSVPNGLGPNGPNGHGPLGPGPGRTQAQWARARGPGQGPMGPMGMGPWAQTGPGPNGHGPMGPGPGRTRTQHLIFNFGTKSGRQRN